MKKILYLVPVNPRSGLTTIALGMIRAFDQLGVRVAFFKPLRQHENYDPGPERSTHFIRITTELNPSPPIPLEQAERLANEHQTERLMSEVMAAFQKTTASNSSRF